LPGWLKGDPAPSRRFDKSPYGAIAEYEEFSIVLLALRVY